MSQGDHLSLPSRRRFRSRPANTWSREELGRLRELAANGTPVPLISSLLRRTVSAVRNKAGMHGISLGAAGSRAKTCAGQSASTVSRSHGCARRVG